MFRPLLSLLKCSLLVMVAICAARGQGALSPGPVAEISAGKTSVMVIPVREAIDEPVLYILRRGLKEAIAQKMDAVVLDMKTPGGRSDITLEIIEALDKFGGRTITYVNNEATSAGALIAAVTDEIYFSPRGTLGASAAVRSDGSEIPETMKLKINSFIQAKIRAYSDGKSYRAEVVAATMDKDFEFKIGDEVIKPKGILLSLTASEAKRQFGEKQETLLSSGTMDSLADLLAQKFGADGYTLRELKVTWSEELAQYLNAIKPVLLGLGLLALFIEFKTPGFGIFGISGIVLLAIVFLSSYVAGLSGHEPMLLFAVGLLLVAVEIFFFPGVVVVALAGVGCMLGSLVWAMADLWPNEPFTVAWSGDVFVQPLMNLALGLAISVALGAALLRYLPRGWVWDKLVLSTAVEGAAQRAGSRTESGSRISALVGRSGVAVTALRPGGQVEIDGERFEARVDVGSVAAGATVVVRGVADFSLIVEEVRT